MNYSFNFWPVFAKWQLLLQGVVTTLELTLLTTVLGIFLGSFCAAIRTSGPRWARGCVKWYVEIIRNTPLLVQAYFLVFGLASTGIHLSIFFAAALALTINVGAYTAEIVRAGIESVSRGQTEAAECLGLTRVQTYLHVIIRPALERVYPSLTSQYILLMLFSSILSAVGVDELFGTGQRIVSETFRNFEVFIVIGIIYLILSGIVRFGFWLLGQIIFPRRRRLKTPL